MSDTSRGHGRVAGQPARGPGLRPGDYGRGPYDGQLRPPPGAPRRRRRRRRLACSLVVVVRDPGRLGIGDQVAKGYAQNEVASADPDVGRAQRQAVGQHRGLAVPHPGRSRTTSRRSTSARTTSPPAAARSRSTSPPRRPACTSTPRSTARRSTTSTARLPFTYQSLDSYRGHRDRHPRPERRSASPPDPAAGPERGQGGPRHRQRRPGRSRRPARVRSTVKFGCARRPRLAARRLRLDPGPGHHRSSRNCPPDSSSGHAGVTSQGIVVPASASNTTLTQ